MTNKASYFLKAKLLFISIFSIFHITDLYIGVTFRDKTARTSPTIFWFLEVATFQLNHQGSKLKIIVFFFFNIIIWRRLQGCDKKSWPTPKVKLEISLKTKTKTNKPKTSKMS